MRTWCRCRVMTMTELSPGKSGVTVKWEGTRATFHQGWSDVRAEWEEGTNRAYVRWYGNGELWREGPAQIFRYEWKEA